MSETSWRNVPAGRWLLVLTLLVAWVALGLHVLSISGIAHPVGPARWLDLAWLATTPAWLIATVLYGAALAFFLVGRQQLRAGVSVLLMLALYTLIEQSQWPANSGVQHGKFLPGAMLGAYLLAVRFGRGTEHQRGRLGHELACAIIAATYGLAAVAKLRASGRAWFDGGPLGLTIVERSFLTEGWMAELRRWVGVRNDVCLALAIMALLLEVLAVGFLIPRWRRRLAILLIGMHCAIGLLLGYAYLLWWPLLAGMAWSTIALDPAA